MALINRKINYNEPYIKIRIIKALADEKPFGKYKHFIMIKMLRDMKRPNVITHMHMWKYLEETFPEAKYFKEEQDDKNFEDIFRE